MLSTHFLPGSWGRPPAAHGLAMPSGPWSVFSQCHLPSKGLGEPVCVPHVPRVSPALVVVGCRYSIEENACQALSREEAVHSLEIKSWICIHDLRPDKQDRTRV